jgi:hypothetical protein
MSGQLLVHRMGHPGRQMNYKLASNMKMWKVNGNTKDLKFYIKRDGENEHLTDGTLKQHSLPQVWTC